MTNSNKQIRLAQEAAELSEEKNAALSAKQWELNGNANFDYDALMGDAAMNSDNGLYMVMTSGKDGKVVLNNRYAQAMLNALIPQTGGNASDSSLSTFMNYVVGAPKSANSWLDVINDTNAQALQQAQTAAANFNSKYGSVIPETGSTRQIDSEQKGFTLNGLLNSMGKSAVANKSYYDLVKDSEDFVVCLWKGDSFGSTATSKASQSLDKYVDQIINALHTALGTDVDILKEKAKSLCDSIKATFSQTDNMRSSAWGDSDRWARKNLVHCGKQGFIGYRLYNNDSNYSLGDYSSRRDNYENAININLSELVRRLINTVTGGLAGGISNSSMYEGKNSEKEGSYTDNRQYFLNNSSFKYTVQKGKDVENTNGNNVTYNQWIAAYNALSNYAKTIVCEKYLSEDSLNRVSNPNAHITNLSSDVQTLNKYRQIYDEACNGWILDGSVSNRNALTSKLENNQYVIKHGDKKSTIKNSKDFKQVNVNDEDDIESYYDVEEKRLKVKEKKLQTEQDRIQVELSSVSSELQSIQTLIQKNIERGFGYGYNS